MTYVIQLFGMFLILLIAGCGGPTEEAQTTTVPDSEPGLNVAIVNTSQSGDTDSFTENEVISISVTMLDDDGVALSGKLVSFSLTENTGQLSKQDGLTDVDGNVAVTISAPEMTSDSVAGVLTVSSDDVSTDATVNFEFTAVDEVTTGLTLTLINMDTSQEDRSLLETEDGRVDIRYIDASGSPEAYEIVNVAVNVGGGLLSQSSVLTDQNGEASIFLYAPEIASGSEPGSLSASSGTVTSEALNYEFVANNVVDPNSVTTGIHLKMTKASDGAEENSITIDEIANLLVTLYDNDGNTLADEIVYLTATSGTLSQASVLTDSNGQAAVTIEAPDTLTFGTAPGVVTASSDVTTQDTLFNYEFVATEVTDDGDSAEATSISFDSVSQNIISLKGTGTSGFGESALVNFTVYNGLVTVANAKVNFVLTTSVGGIRFDKDGAEAIDEDGDFTTTTAVSDSQGKVSVMVHSGNIATPVRVTAFIDLDNGETIFVQSNVLTITTGIPDQNSMTLSYSKLVSEGASLAGDEVSVTARLGDRFNNPVPDGTVVNFTTEGGLIDGSCTTTNSACSVTWRSQNPVPADGRSTVMAHVIGHETYFDENGSGVFDNGDEFVDLPEAFRDDDENGVFDPDASDAFTHNHSRDELFIDYDGSANYSSADGDYNGVPCNHDTDCPTDANNLAGRSSSLVDVREDGLIIMAESFASIDIREISAGAHSCLGADGKYLTDGSCTQTNSITFATGANTVRLWVLIEDAKALCTASAPDDSTTPHFTRVDAVRPNDGACLHATRQSVATGSSISIEATAGALSNLPYTVVPNQYGPLEFIVLLTSSDQNEEDESGALNLNVTSPVTESVSTVSIEVFDPAN